MKKTIFLFLFSLFLIGCKGEIKQISQNNVITKDKNILGGDTIQGINTLKEFYLTFYGDDNAYKNKKSKEQYISDRVLKRIDSLSGPEEVTLDYDPFIQAQDYFGNIIRKTIEVKPLKNKNEYKVSFLLFGEKNEKRTEIDLLLKKDSKGNFLIDAILNDEYLNFKKNLNTSEKKSSIPISGNYSPNYELSFDNIKYNEDSLITNLTINIKNKKNNQLQTISYSPEYCSSIPSKAVALKANSKGIIDSDNTLEDNIPIIFADFNFDGKEDFAIINDQANNVGTQYSYFLQDERGNFSINEFLTEKIGLFPTEINNNNKTITLINPIGCCNISTRIFQKEKTNWKLIQSKTEKMN